MIKHILACLCGGRGEGARGQSSDAGEVRTPRGDSGEGRRAWLGDVCPEKDLTKQVE